MSQANCKPERIAFLVIHGIGQQKPYETLDQFTRNLMQNFGDGWSIQPVLDRAADPTHANKAWVRTSFLVEPPAGTAPAFKSDSNCHIKDITFFEYYWAPITQGKITYRGSLLFLVRAGLQPFLFLISNVNVIRLASGGKFLAILARELYRQLFLFIPLLALLFSLLMWLGNAGDRINFLHPHLKATTVIALGLLAIRYLYLLSTARALDQSRRIKSGWQSKMWWKLTLAITFLIHLIAWPLWLSSAIDGIAWLGSRIAQCQPWIRYLGHWSNGLRELAATIQFPWGSAHSWIEKLQSFIFFDPHFAAYTGPVFVVLVALWLRSILTGVIGDVAVYVNSDTFSSSFAARTQILEECSAALTAILTEKSDPADPQSAPVYDRVLIAAHSLGSIIAYDTMNQMLNVARTDVPGAPGVTSPLAVADLNRLRGVVTFGCPLNKIFYFFRPLESPQYTLRIQTLNLLHGFRLKSGLMKNDDLKPQLFPFSKQCAQPQTWIGADAALKSGFTWINAYSPMDPISGNLIFHEVEHQLSIKHLPPLVAHVRYWEDQNFYSFVCQYLL